jgi:uncharacterized protein (DUF934 family)
MPQLIKHRAIVADGHTLVRSAATLDDLPQQGAVIVPLALWLAERDALLARGDVGVWLAPAEHPGALAEDVERLSLIAIDFPQFSDGRGYSHARLLRERYRFAGELRAIGDVQRDQLYYLAQCGFDAFLVPDGRDAEDALNGFADFSDGYQATTARTPWFRRRQAVATAGDVWFPCA